MSLRVPKFSVNLPFGLGGVEIEVSDAERRAAWNLYVEYSTRVATQALTPGSGDPAAALASLHSLFDTTREVLREAGPEAGKGPDSVGAVAIKVLNEGLRPFTTKWHGAAASSRADFDAELAGVQQELDSYVGELGKLAGVR